MLFAALPWLLLLIFLVFPMVSSSAFRAFSCEDFDNGRSFLRADYGIECGTDTYARVEQLAWLGILLYPVGRPACLDSSGPASTAQMGLVTQNAHSWAREAPSCCVVAPRARSPQN